jgi:hypothetical protein
MQNLKTIFMKYSFYTLLMCGLSVAASAQVNRPVLSAGNHTTLDSVKVSYGAVSVSTGTVNTSAIYVNAEVRVTLKPGAAPDKIYLQVLRKQDSSLVYAVNHTLSTAATAGGPGQLFFGQGRYFYIMCPVAMPLSTYIYKVYTQSPQGSNSSTFITKQ